LPKPRDPSEPIRKFLSNVEKNIDQLSAEKMIQESAINPFLAKALGFDDFDSLARFYVYQRVGRSIVTSFGMTLENIVREIIRGKRGNWWDVVKKGKTKSYYLSVKSGPRDMNKDQTLEFVRRAREILEKDSTAYPIIAMAYGKKVWSVIVHTLKDEGFDPSKHALAGSKLYQEITGDKDYHKKLLDLVVKIELEDTGGKTILELLDDKAKEISKDFKQKYSSVEELLYDTF